MYFSCVEKPFKSLKTLKVSVKRICLFPIPIQGRNTGGGGTEPTHPGKKEKNLSLPSKYLYMPVQTLTIFHPAVYIDINIKGLRHQVVMI